MALFEVNGWNLSTDKVAYGKATKKSTEKKQKREKSRKELRKNIKDRKSTIEDAANDEWNEQYEPVQDEPSDAEEEVEHEKKRKHDRKDSKKTKKRSLEESKIEEEEEVSEPKPLKKNLTPLQQKMMAKLTGSRFRWINEQLYTISSQDALKLVKEQPEVFDEYHDGFRSQVQAWPENPVNVFVDQIRQRAAKAVNAPGGLPGLKDNDKKIVIADMGCGEAQLALDINNYFSKYNKSANKFMKRNHIVHSFDLKKANERITVADIRNVPLPDNSCTIVVFCLALMGTNFLDFIKEAYRILAPNGELWIAEIKSRFGDNKGDEFVNALKLMGFFHKKTDDDNKMFTRFEFFKPPQNIIEERKAKLERRQKFIEVQTEKEELETKRKKTAEGKWLLKPCIYKRR